MMQNTKNHSMAPKKNVGTLVHQTAKQWLNDLCTELWVQDLAGQCVVSLGKTVYLDSSTQEYIWVLANYWERLMKCCGGGKEREGGNLAS